MGTVDQYAQRVPKKKWTPPNDEVTAQMQASKAKYDEIEATMAEIKADVLAFVALGAPVITLAELYGVQRKTIYRWMGQEMS